MRPLLVFLLPLLVFLLLLLVFLLLLLVFLLAGVGRNRWRRRTPEG